MRLQVGAHNEVGSSIGEVSPALVVPLPHVLTFCRGVTRGNRFISVRYIYCAYASLTI
jgi:hypothetical protein